MAKTVREVTCKTADESNTTSQAPHEYGSLGTSSKPKQSNFIIVLTVFASVGGALFGYDTGVVSGALPLVGAHKNTCPKYDGFGLTNFEKEAFVDATIGGAILGSALSGFFCDRFGRRPVIMFGAVLFTLGSVILALANGLAVLIVGRVVVGLAIGFASHTTPMYIAEVAPADIRGQLVSTFNVFIACGQVCAGAIDGAFFYLESGWRYMLGFAAIFSILQFVGFIFLPESPRWLVKQNRASEATEVLKKIRASSDVSEEIADIQAAIQNPQVMSWREILTTPSTRKPLLLGCFLMFLQQFVGINTVMYYSATIIQEAGFGGSGDLCCCHRDAIPIWLACGTAVAEFVGCAIGMFLADRAGRRPLILWSISGVIVMLGVLGLGYIIPASSAVKHSLLMIGLVGYLLCFGIGMSPVPWILNSELYPLRARSRCAAAGVATNWASNFIIAGTFLSVSHTIGTGETFWIFGVIAIIGLVILVLVLPETIGKSLEELEVLFEPKSSRVHASAVENATATQSDGQKTRLLPFA